MSRRACSARMTRAQARMQSSGPRVLTRSTRSNSSGSMSVSSPAWPTPAVIVTWSGMPQRRRVSSTAASIASGSATSQVTSRSPATSHTTTVRARRPVGVDQCRPDARRAPDDQCDRPGLVAHCAPFRSDPGQTVPGGG